LFIGLFSSGILICAVAIITYFSERNKAIYQLYCACLDFSQALSFGKVITSRDEFLALKSEVNQATSIYNKDMQFLLDDLSALRKNQKLLKQSTSFGKLRLKFIMLYLNWRKTLLW
jgi:hypothetical protein